MLVAGTDGRDSEAGSQRRMEGRPGTGLCSHKSLGGRETTTKMQSWQGQQEKGPVCKLQYPSGISKQKIMGLILFEGPAYVKNNNCGLAAHVTDSCYVYKGSSLMILIKQCSVL